MKCARTTRMIWVSPKSGNGPVLRLLNNQLVRVMSEWTYERCQCEGGGIGTMYGIVVDNVRGEYSVPSEDMYIVPCDGPPQDVQPPLREAMLNDTDPLDGPAMCC